MLVREQKRAKEFVTAKMEISGPGESRTKYRDKDSKASGPFEHYGGGRRLELEAEVSVTV